MAMPKGDGTEKNPYLVETAKDLDAVREDLTAHYKQTADIDLSDIPHWEPIGPVFQGTYDGDFHKPGSVGRIPAKAARWGLWKRNYRS